MGRSDVTTWSRHFKSMQEGKIHPNENGIWTVKDLPEDNKLGKVTNPIKVISPTELIVQQATALRKKRMQRTSNTPQCSKRRKTTVKRDRQRHRRGKTSKIRSSPLILKRVKKQKEKAKKNSKSDKANTIWRR